MCVSIIGHTLKIITKGVCLSKYTSLLNVIEFTDNNLLSAADVRLAEAPVIKQRIESQSQTSKTVFLFQLNFQSSNSV